MTRLSAGEALAAAGLLIAGTSMLDQTGPGFGKTLSASTDDAGVRAHLTSAELGTTVVIVGAGIVAAALTKAAWPIVVAVVAIAVAVAVHEGALRIDPEG